MLMSSHEALRSLYGEISTERDGDQTHQCIQTNLADVICGGNPNDKILYARTSTSGSKQRSSSLAGSHKTLERRHSLRIFGSSKRLQRSASTRSLSKNYAQTIAKDGTPAQSSTMTTAAASSSSSENQSNCDTSKCPSERSVGKPVHSSTVFALVHRKTSVFPVSAVEDLQAKHSIEEQIETARDLLGAVSTAGVVQLEDDAPAQRRDADHGLYGECLLMIVGWVSTGITI